MKAYGAEARITAGVGCPRYKEAVPEILENGLCHVDTTQVQDQRRTRLTDEPRYLPTVILRGLDSAFLPMVRFSTPSFSLASIDSRLASSGSVNEREKLP